MDLRWRGLQSAREEVYSKSISCKVGFQRVCRARRACAFDGAASPRTTPAPPTPHLFVPVATGGRDLLTSGKNLLVFDDLLGSGATVARIVEALKNPGLAKAVYLLTLTTK
jgi:hypothetical protein